MPDFAMAVVKWQKRHGRHDLPWQHTRDPYKIWLSEIMLQQTQVAAVIPYYEAFVRRFPSVAVLARAQRHSVLAQWSGLGYYARTRNLHAAAKIMHTHGFPADAAGWEALPGVGRSTASAIAVFAGGQRCAILDGNVKRVLARTHRLPHPINSRAGEEALWQLAATLLPPPRHIRPYTQGLMDLGATVCRRKVPLCESCPLATQCAAHQHNETAHYPQRQARADKPHKRAHFALVCSGEQVLLQQQPPRGIWGGLWSLPAADGDWRQHFRRAPAATGELAFRHTFTHYHLHARVTLYRARTAVAVTPPLRWHRHWQKAALPAPIKTVLMQQIANTTTAT